MCPPPFLLGVQAHVLRPHTSPPAAGVGLTRSISFRTVLPPNMFGPTSTRVTKTQRVAWYRGNVIQLDSSAVSHDVPYGDHFTTEDRFLVQPQPKGGVRVRVAAHVNFIKSTIFRGKIRTEGMKGIRAFDEATLPRMREFLATHPECLAPAAATAAAAAAPAAPAAAEVPHHGDDQHAGDGRNGRSGSVARGASLGV